MSKGRILIVDDEPDIRGLLSEILGDEGYTVAVAENARTAKAQFIAQRPELVLLDIWMPEVDGLTLLKEWHEGNLTDTAVVMISGHGNVETAVEAVRLGAEDFIEKPLSTAKLLVTVERAIAALRLKQENRRLRARGAYQAELVGDSAAMRELRAQVERMAAHDAWVLITGEPGSGKAVTARYLHARSRRREQPLIETSLVAVPEQNVATQLFGSETAIGVHAGSLEQANGGTLLLDEVGDLTLGIQAQLVSALDERRFLRVGGSTPVEVDVRVIAVTREDLASAVSEGRFREDLYYRLNVLPLTVPALREHKEDVPALIDFYVRQAAEQDHLPAREFTADAMTLLRNYSWPGNVRELKNLVQRLLILHREGPIGAAAVRQALHQVGDDTRTIPEHYFELPLRTARDLFEKEYLEHHLRRTGGNVSDVAASVEMERTHLYRKLRGLGINYREAKDE